jgi:hypothetical protein
MSNATVSIPVPALPCVSLPTLTPLSVSLPLGGSLSAMGDFSVGTPSNCTMTFNLLVQVTPMLASIACLIKILGVIGALKDVFSSLPTPDLGKLFSAIEAATECIVDVAVPIIPFVQTIIDILKLIVAFLTCFVDELTSIVNIQLSINLDAAQGDPALLAALQCAQQNATTSMNNLNAGIAGLQPLIAIIGTLASIAGVPLNLSLTPPPAGSDPLAAIAHLKATVDNINQIVQSLPG